MGISRGAAISLFPIGILEFVVRKLTLPITNERPGKYAISHCCYRCNLVVAPDDPFKMNGFIALVLVALAVGLMQGCRWIKLLAPSKPVSAERSVACPDHGFWRNAGQNAGRLRWAQRIATTLIAKFGKKHIQWAWY